MDEDDIHVGEMARRIGYQLRADTTAMEARYGQMAKVGVRPARATALVYKNLHPGCDQTELARVLGINKASTTAAVDGLVALGAVERRPGRDRRSNALHLTDHGRRLRDDCVKVTAEHDAHFFRALTDGERAELICLLVKVRDADRATAPRTTASERAILRRVK